MPPAFVLSQNQTLKLKTDKPGGIGLAGRHLWEPFPAQKYKLVCLRLWTYETVWLSLIVRYPEAIEDQAAARMSLHLNRQCQRANAFCPPVLVVPGAGRSDWKKREAKSDPSGPSPLL